MEDLPKLNLILRGHIRSSFQDERLKTFFDSILQNFDTNVYIQTWNILQSNLSWRRIQEINDAVNQDLITNYLKTDKIRKILILDDSKINHIGKTEGRIGRTPCPVLGWKNMYYGMLASVRSVIEAEGGDGITVQMRMDILSNPFSPSKQEIIDFLQRELSILSSNNIGDEAIRFLRMHCFLGVDNIYMAKTEDLHKFISYMYYDMDRIIHVHRGTIHQEHIAFHERRSAKNWNPPSDPVQGLVSA